jgi:hypothetical protein
MGALLRMAMNGLRRPNLVRRRSLKRPTRKPSRKSSDLVAATAAACVAMGIPRASRNSPLRTGVRTRKSNAQKGSRSAP